jgi:hypothetical protein
MIKNKKTSILKKKKDKSNKSLKPGLISKKCIPWSFLSRFNLEAQFLVNLISKGEISRKILIEKTWKRKKNNEKKTW